MKRPPNCRLFMYQKIHVFMCSFRTKSYQILTNCKFRTIYWPQSTHVFISGLIHRLHFTLLSNQYPVGALYSSLVCIYLLQESSKHLLFISGKKQHTLWLLTPFSSFHIHCFHVPSRLSSHPLPD